MVEFVPKPGQIDYSKARWVPILNCVVKKGNKILLVKRGKGLKYPGHWNGISGYLDDKKSFRAKVEEELREELGIHPSQISKIKQGNVFDYKSKRYGKIWITHPAIVIVRDVKIKLNWEASEYKWVLPHKALSFKLVPGFDRVLLSLSEWLSA